MDRLIHPPSTNIDQPYWTEWILQEVIHNRFSFVQVALQKVQDLKDPLPTLWLWHHKREDTWDRRKQVDVGNRQKGEVIFWQMIVIAVLQLLFGPSTFCCFKLYSSISILLFTMISGIEIKNIGMSQN